MKYSLLVILYILSSFYMYSQDTLVRSGDSWQYYIGEQSPPEEWNRHEISDHNWETGITPFGDKQITGTKINCSLGTKDGAIVGHFSKTIFIDNPYDKLAYEIRLRRDDGVVVYINGHEFWRSNVSDDVLSEDVIAIEPVHVEENEAFIIKIFPPEDFRDGLNTIGISLYTWGEESANCTFDFELIEHNNFVVVPELLRYVDEESDLLESKLRELSYQEEINEQKTKYALLEQTNSYNRKILLLSLILIIGGVSLWYKQQISRKQQISKLKETINKNREEKLNYLYNSLKVNQHIEKIRNNLMNLIDSKEILPKDLKRIIQSINFIGDKEKDWATMETEFNLLNSGYLTRLKETYPALSRTELRHCIFIKLHVPTKELAELMNIEPRSVQTIRYRIKKKLNLSEEIDLREFLFKF